MGVLEALLADRLGSEALVADPIDRGKYESGWRYGQGRARCVVRPGTTGEVAFTLRACHDAGVPVLPQGANTGLVGASVPDASGSMVVLSLERLTRRLEVDPFDRTVLVDGGVTLGRLNEALAPHGLLFPIDLGADPQIGGMVATNTGGTRLLKHGDVRRQVLGLEVVLADGTVLDLLKGLRKDNTGLDLKQAFIGTFGAFGVVTASRLQVVPRPRQRATALVGLAQGESVLALLQVLEAGAGDLLSAFEVISAEAWTPIFRHHPRLRNPYGNQEPPPFTALVELATTLPVERLDLADLLEGLLAEHLEGPSGKGVTDIFPGRPEDLWELRHHVSESLRHEGSLLGLDLSVPRSALPAFTTEVRDWIARAHPFVRVCDFGHWGDGGTHLNLVWDPSAAPKPEADFKAELQERVYRMAVEAFGGSFSAEHGIGPHNQAFYDAFTPPAVKAACALLKGHFDPARRLGTVRLD